MRQVDWYFDFISPFSYLQSVLLRTLPANVEIRFKPLLVEFAKISLAYRMKK